METKGGGDGEAAAAAGLRQACASCKHRRKRCAEGCFLAKYFPAEKQGEFRAVQKVFGLSNLTKMLRANATEAARQRAARTLTWEAQCRHRDPADGCFRELAALRRENRLLRGRIAALGPALLARRYPTLPPPPQFLHHDALQDDDTVRIFFNNSNDNLVPHENLSYHSFNGAASVSPPPSFVDQCNFSSFDDDDDDDDEPNVLL